MVEQGGEGRQTGVGDGVKREIEVLEGGVLLKFLEELNGTGVCDVALFEFDDV